MRNLLETSETLERGLRMCQPSLPGNRTGLGHQNILAPKLQTSRRRRRELVGG